MTAQDMTGPERTRLHLAPQEHRRYLALAAQSTVRRVQLRFAPDAAALRKPPWPSILPGPIAGSMARGRQGSWPGPWHGQPAPARRQHGGSLAPAWQLRGSRIAPAWQLRAYQAFCASSSSVVSSSHSSSAASFSPSRRARSKISASSSSFLPS